MKSLLLKPFFPLYEFKISIKFTERENKEKIRGGRHFSTKANTEKTPRRNASVSKHYMQEPLSLKNKMEKMFINVNKKFSCQASHGGFSVPTFREFKSI